MKTQSISFFLLISLSACFGLSKQKSVKTDLDNACAELNRIQSVEKDPVARAAMFAAYLDDNLQDEDVQKVFQALAAVDPSEKYKVILRFANEESKLKDWSCPAMEQNFATGLR